MIKSIEFQGHKIIYSINGRGPAIVFLHGYLESRLIWKDFSDRFYANYLCIEPDIPGHGESGMLQPVHSMELMAEVLGLILQEENVNKTLVIGHSMGGYVAMEFLHRYPDLCSGLVLLHSTCFADSEEKRLNRDREISLVKCGKKMQIIHTNIPKAFHDENLELLKEEIDRAKSIAAGSPDDGIIALLRGMQERADRSITLSESKVPTLLVWGRGDNYIPHNVFVGLHSLKPSARTLVLEHSGHMGFLEEPELLSREFEDFLAGLDF